MVDAQGAAAFAFIVLNSEDRLIELSLGGLLEALEVLLGFFPEDFDVYLDVFQQAGETSLPVLFLLLFCHYRSKLLVVSA